MPSPWAVLQRLDVVTGPFGYVRLLGDRAEVDRLTKTLDHIVIDRVDQIEADARAIKRLSGRVPVVTFVNNHFAGYGPVPVATRKPRLRKSKPGYPSTLHACE